MWDDDNSAELRRLWAAGQSMLDIANAFGVTRNVIAGKLYRLGLKRSVTDRLNRQKSAAHNKRTETMTKAKGGKPPMPKPPRGPDGQLVVWSAPPTDTKKTIAEVGSGDCRWPIDAHDEYGIVMFCGRPQANGSYCAGHARIAYSGNRYGGPSAASYGIPNIR